MYSFSMFPIVALEEEDLACFPDLESNEAAKFLPDFPKLPERRRLSGALLLSGEARQDQIYNIGLIAE